MRRATASFTALFQRVRHADEGDQVPAFRKVQNRLSLARKFCGLFFALFQRDAVLIHQTGIADQTYLSLRAGGSALAAVIDEIFDLAERNFFFLCLRHHAFRQGMIGIEFDAASQ